MSNPIHTTDQTLLAAELERRTQQIAQKIISAGSQDKQLAFKRDLEAVIIQLQTMLIDKNVKYGDAALNPNQTFSRCDSIELINVRIDDKLSRIRNRQANEDEDPEWDLLGYLVLKQIAKRRLNQGS